MSSSDDSPSVRHAPTVAAALLLAGIVVESAVPRTVGYRVGNALFQAGFRGVSLWVAANSVAAISAALLVGAVAVLGWQAWFFWRHAERAVEEEIEPIGWYTVPSTPPPETERESVLYAVSTLVFAGAVLVFIALTILY